MKFEDLNAAVPFATGGKMKSLYMDVYKSVRLTMPGRHGQETQPVGGDFCVEVSDWNSNWNNKQFTHTDIFKDVQAKFNADSTKLRLLVDMYESVVADGNDPEAFTTQTKVLSLPGVDPMTFLYATQCLALAEHRRYARYERQLGGRYLPLRFVFGIANGYWTDVDAALKQKMGRPGVEWLERTSGLPAKTAKLKQRFGV